MIYKITNKTKDLIKESQVNSTNEYRHNTNFNIHINSNNTNNTDNRKHSQNVATISKKKRTSLIP